MGVPLLKCAEYGGTGCMGPTWTKLVPNMSKFRGPKQLWQPETWQGLFLHPEIGQLSPHFGAISLLNCAENPAEKGEKSTGESSKHPVEQLPRNWRFLSLVVVERVLSVGHHFAVLCFCPLGKAPLSNPGQVSPGLFPTMFRALLIFSSHTTTLAARPCEVSDRTILPC